MDDEEIHFVAPVSEDCCLGRPSTRVLLGEETIEGSDAQ